MIICDMKGVRDVKYMAIKLNTFRMIPKLILYFDNIIQYVMYLQNPFRRTSYCSRGEITSQSVMLIKIQGWRTVLIFRTWYLILPLNFKF